MEGFGARWLILLAVAGAITTAASAGAEMSGTNRPPSPSYQRTAFAPATPRGSRQPWAGDHRAYAREIAEAADRYAVPERLIWAVIRVESGFDHRAVSPKGARGLMQLMPETAAILGVRDSFDPRENIHGGTRHLRALMERFRYDLQLAVAAYNAGERPVLAFGGVPPYPETREYVTQVMRFYNVPTESGQWQGRSDIRRFVEPDGTVVYTNIPYGRFSTVSRGR